MYIRYRQIEIAIATEQIKLRKCWNTTSMVIGAMGCLGMSLVANFQETSIMIIHGLGAVLAFGIGSAYFIIEVSLTLKLFQLFLMLGAQENYNKFPT